MSETEKKIIVNVNLDFEFYVYERDQCDCFDCWNNWTVKDFLEYKESVNDNLFQPVIEAEDGIIRILRKLGFKQKGNHYDYFEFYTCLDISGTPHDLPDAQSPPLILVFQNRKKFFEKIKEINKEFMKYKSRYVTIFPITVTDLIDKADLLDRIFCNFSDCWSINEKPYPCAFRSDVLEYIENQFKANDDDDLEEFYNIFDKKDLFPYIWQLCLELWSYGYIEDTGSDSQVTIKVDCYDVDHKNYKERALSRG